MVSEGCRCLWGCWGLIYIVVVFPIAFLGDQFFSVRPVQTLDHPLSNIHGSGGSHNEGGPPLIYWSRRVVVV